MIRISLLLAVAVLLAPAVSAQCGPLANHVVINEVSYDDSSTDDREFVELYNPTGAPVDISNWVLECLDQVWISPMVGDNNPDYTIPAGTMLAAGAYYVMGAPSVPNVTQVLVHPISMTSTDLFENSQESMALRDATGNIVDSFSYEMNKARTVGPLATSYPFFAAGGVEGTGYWGNFTSINSSIGASIDGQGEQSLARYTDGVDTDDNGFDFGQMPQTPGTSNTILISQLPYLENFDLAMVETPVLNPISMGPVWSTSFVEARIVDPTLVGSNPNAITASPGSGANAMIMWDPTGGGNAATLISTPQADWRIEFYMYLEAAPYQTPGTDFNYESSSVGVRGSTDTYANHPVITGVPWVPVSLIPAVTASANTGVAWVYRRQESYGTVSPAGFYHSLNLVDYGNAGDDPVIIASYPITAGLNDGWQYLTLEVAGDLVTATFGGMNSNHGNVIAKVHGTTQATGCGGVYLGYREFASNNAESRPITIDDFLMLTPGSTNLGVFLDQPLGTGSLRIAHRGMTPGVLTFTAITINEPCPAPLGPGLGGFLGLCASNVPLLLSSLNNTFYPFQFAAPASALELSFVDPALVGLYFEALTAQATIPFTISGVAPLSVQ